MITAEEIGRLMKYDQETRIFCLNGMKYIDGKIMGILESSNRCSGGFSITLSMEEIFFLSFDYNEINGVKHVKGRCKDPSVERFVTYEDLKGRSWKEIIEASEDFMHVSIVKTMFNKLKDELEYRGYKVHFSVRGSISEMRISA